MAHVDQDVIAATANVVIEDLLAITKSTLAPVGFRLFRCSENRGTRDRIAKWKKWQTHLRGENQTAGGHWACLGFANYCQTGLFTDAAVGQKNFRSEGNFPKLNKLIHSNRLGEYPVPV